MIVPRITKLLTLTVVSALPCSLCGNGMRLLSQDGFASARGEAFAATADNPSAVYYNPAGITQIQGLEARAGVYGLYFDTTFAPPADAPNSNNSYSLEENLAAAPQFFCAYTPTNQPVSFGLGIYAPYGAGVSWPEDTGFRAVAIEGALLYVRFNPVVAVELTPTLSVGAGLAVDYGDIMLEQGLRANAQPFANHFRFEGDGWSLGYNVGLLWKPHEKLAFGATFRSTTTLSMEGETSFEQQPIIQPTQLPAEADFQFPMTVVLGVSFRPTPRWNVEFNADYANWSSLSTVMIRQKETPPFPVQQDISVTLNWEASWAYELGVTRFFEHGWHASAGYVFNENSVPDDYYTPLVPDMDRHFVSVGVGRKGKRFDFDLVYQFGYGPERTVTGSQPSSTPGLFAGQSADGTYEFISHALLITAGVRF